MNKVSFSFGAAFGRSALDSCALRAKYGDAALEAQRWINTTPFDTEGHGWMALPDCSTAQVAETAEWLRGYDSVIQVGIGGSALGNLMLNQALLGRLLQRDRSETEILSRGQPGPGQDALDMGAREGRKSCARRRKQVRLDGRDDDAVSLVPRRNA